LVRGVSYKKSDASTSPRPDLTPILRANNIGDGRLNFDELVYVPPQEISEKQYIRALDVVIAMSSGSKKLVGKAGQATSDCGCGFGAFCGLVRISELLDKKYVGLFFQSEIYKKAISKLSSGVNINNLRRQHIEDMPIPLAPLSEQRRIVEKIEELFAKLDTGVKSLKQTQALLKSYRRSVLKAAVEGELSREWREAHRDELEPASELLERILQERREKFTGKKYKEPVPPDTSELSALPNGWEWATWAQIGTSQNGRAFPSKEYSSSGVKLLRPGNLHADGLVRWTEKNTRYMPEKWATDYPSHLVGPRELVINLTAQSLADEFLGRVCFTGSGEHCLLNQRIARLTPTTVLPKYLLWMFKSHVFRRYVDSLNTGSLIQHMFTSQIAEFSLPLPPLEEQRFIVEEVERRLSVVDKLEATVETNLKQANGLRQSILKRAFSGELVPQGPDDEPASVLLERIRAERQAAKPKARKSSTRPAKRSHAEQGGLF
jgi:type I restriction enzyme S subunit